MRQSDWRRTSTASSGRGQERSLCSRLLPSQRITSKRSARILNLQQRSIERGPKLQLAERLEQARRRAALHKHLADGRINPGGDEYHWHPNATRNKLLLQLGTRDAWHANVQQQALRPEQILERQKLLCRGEPPRGEPELPQQIGQRLAHRFVVINDRHEWLRRRCLRCTRPIRACCHEGHDVPLHSSAL